MGATAGTSEAVTLNTPVNNGTAIGNYEFTWSSVADASYYIDIARDDLFTDLILSRETTGTSFPSSYLPDLEKGTYYWRIRLSLGPNIQTLRNTDSK